MTNAVPAFFTKPRLTRLARASRQTGAAYLVKPGFLLFLPLLLVLLLGLDRSGRRLLAAGALLGLAGLLLVLASPAALYIDSTRLILCAWPVYAALGRCLSRRGAAERQVVPNPLRRDGRPG